MNGPRNRVAFARGQQHREQIRELLASRPQTLPMLTAEQIRQQLALPISQRMVQEHVRRIQQLGCGQRNLSAATPTLG